MYEFAKTIVQPYSVLMFVMGCTLLYIWFRRDVGRKPLLLITVVWLAIFAISAPVVSSALLDTLRLEYSPPAELPADVDAIVTLGGGISPPAQFRDDPQVDGVSFGRCLHTAAIYEHLGKCTIIVSGGPSRRVPGGPTVAEVMRDTLVKFGVAKGDIVIETDSLSTYENAVNSSKVLKDLDLKKAVLVTDSRHMPRAVMCFRKQGVDVVPAPSDFSFERAPSPLYETAIPSSGGLRGSHKAFHEWLGMAWYWFHGRI